MYTPDKTENCKITKVALPPKLVRWGLLCQPIQLILCQILKSINSLAYDARAFFLFPRTYKKTKNSTKKILTTNNQIHRHFMWLAERKLDNSGFRKYISTVTVLMLYRDWGYTLLAHMKLTICHLLNILLNSISSSLNMNFYFKALLLMYNAMQYSPLCLALASLGVWGFPNDIIFAKIKCCQAPVMY